MRKLSPIWLIVLVIASTSEALESCLSVDEDPYLYFGTKTAYIFANRELPNNYRAHEVPGCEPTAFWLIIRPGSNNPEVDEIEGLQNLSNLRDNIVNNYKNGNFRNTDQRMCMSDLNILEQWTWNARHNQTFAGDLTSDGYISTQQLAQAWKQKYPGLLNDNRHNYLFKYANDQRSSTTYRAFTEGLFKTQADGYDLPKENDETLITPYKYCNSWVKNVEENKETLAQREIFESKQEYKEMLTNVSRRLGFNYDIEMKTLKDMYLMCRYNKAWDVTQISPWCAVFSEDDLRRLEYAEDLETYYKYGDGTELNKKIGCTYVKDLMTFFKKHVESETVQQPRSSIWVQEAGGVLLASAAVRRRPAPPLTGDNYRAAPARTWRSSTLAPFGGNLAAILYQCTLNGNFQVKEKYQVLFLENEKPISLEGCRVGLCDWSRVNTLFGELASTCDLESCNSANKIKNSIAIIISVGVLILGIMY